jgi:hypothetical protein
MEFRAAFRPTALVGGSIILVTYAFFAALLLSPLKRLLPRAARAAIIARGGILDEDKKWLTRIWLMSTIVSACTLGTGLVLLSFDDSVNYSNDWAATTTWALGLFISASFWVPLSLLVALDRRWWVRGLAGLPVWATSVFNLLLAFSAREQAYMFILLIPAVFHHTLLDGGVWVYNFVYLPPNPPSRATAHSIALPALVM